MEKILSETRPALQQSFDGAGRRTLMDALGQAGSDYRWNFYKYGFSGKSEILSTARLVDFLELTLLYIDQTLQANRRDDALYHSYNILHLRPDSAAVSHLYEMLEGQVAILSSGLLSGDESLALSKSLRSSALYRVDQRSYILYPDRIIKGFVEKNLLAPQQVKGLALVTELEKACDESLLVCDETGNYHFAGHVHNVKDVKQALDVLSSQPRFSHLVAQDASQIEALFEQTFHHDQFTGRSGTFFAYEGLGSIYWHMVSKLLLAAQETILRYRDEPSAPGLIERYTDIRAGQCFNKSPAEYGAFPTDPYSHTPAGQGAKQPGMSGMVKEEILARQAELGLTIVDGRIVFDFTLFDRRELLESPSTYRFLDTTGRWEQIDLPAGSLAYSICQVPVILQASKQAAIQVYLKNGTQQKLEGLTLNPENSRHIFERDGAVDHLVVSVPN